MQTRGSGARGPPPLRQGRFTHLVASDKPKSPAAGLRATHWWTDAAGDFGVSLSTRD